MTDQIQNNKDLKAGNGFWVLVWDRLLDTLDRVLAQFTSGRWLLTIIAGVCLLHYAWILPPDKQDKIIDLIKDIVIFYFVVRDTNKMEPKSGGTNDTKIIGNSGTINATDTSKG